MTNPFGEVHYDKDGLPIQHPQAQPNPYADPFSQPQQAYMNPMTNMPIPPQQPQQFANVPMQYGAVSPMAVHAVPKQWIVAVLLAFFLGPWGAHNFYLGYTQKAWLQFGLFVGGIITSFLFIGVIPMAAVSIWTFIEFIMLLIGSSPYDRDGQGFPLQK